jgi:predicted metal-dependent phosphotriesterase family hydrolase
MRQLSRRDLLTSSIALLTAGCSSRGSGQAAKGSTRTRAIETVTGPLPADRLGVTLMHEHVLVDFIGADRASPSRYEADEVFAAVLPHLRQARALGCATLVECTPAYLGRDPRLLRRLSEASGLHILSNTGYYGAAKDKHVPAHAFKETAEQLAARWIREAQQGIEGTSIKPAFMKIGVDEGPLSEIDAKLVRAAALTHRETGLPIASHTVTGVAAMEELDLLERAGVPLSAFIWVHAHNERDETFHATAAKRGAWVEFDGISPTSVARHAELVLHMKAQGLLNHVLLSHDAGWYRVGEPGGGNIRAYDTLFTTFLPMLKSSGFSEADINQLVVTNPHTALARR